MRSFSALLTLLCVLLAFTTTAFPQNRPNKKPPRVKVSEAKLRNAAAEETFVGHVEAIETVELQARVQGYLEQVDFREGASVSEGDLLYVIDQAPYTAELDSARGRVAQAKAELFKAQTRLRRLRSARSESVPQTEIDDAKANRDLAQGQLEEAQANLSLARTNLDYTTIKAPIDGRIGKSFSKTGDLVGASQETLARIKKMDPIRVVFSVSEKKIPFVQKASSGTDGDGQDRAFAVRLRFPDGVMYEPRGSVEFIDNQVDRDTGTIAVWARFDNPGSQLVPGQYVNVLLGSGEKDMKPAVPHEAVLRDRQGSFVYVVDEEGVARKRRIQPGPSGKERIVVSSGLSKGENVVVQGVQKLSDGVNVQVVSE